MKDNHRREQLYRVVFINKIKLQIRKIECYSNRITTMHTGKQNENILLLTSFLYIHYNKILCLTKSSLSDFVFILG